MFSSELGNSKRFTNAMEGLYVPVNVAAGIQRWVKSNSSNTTEANTTAKRPECSFRHEAGMFKCHQINGKECMS